MIIRPRPRLWRPGLVVPDRRHLVGAARAGAMGASGRSGTPIVGFISGAEVYNSGSVAFTIASGSFTPAEGCEEVVLCLGARCSGSDDIASFTVTINSVAPDEVLASPNYNGRGGNWIGRWRGAPSGTVSITGEPGDSGSQWSSLLCYGMSLDTACVFGDTTQKDEDAGTANTTGDQTVTTEGENSLLVFCVWADADNDGPFTPDATDTYDERYDGATAIGAGGSIVTVGTKATTEASVAHTLEADWVNSEEWEAKLVEMRAA